jgi:hypothetical protein
MASKHDVPFIELYISKPKNKWNIIPNTVKILVKSSDGLVNENKPLSIADRDP